MKIPRFYQKESFIVNQTVELSAENHRHAVQVLRLNKDDPLTLFNGEGGEYLAKMVEVKKRRSTVFITSFDPVDRESSLKITLILAVIKPEKMDFAIQKAVEMGVSKIQPLYTQRSVIKLKANRLDKKMHHWQGVINSACEQSGRTVIPHIVEPVNLDTCLNHLSVTDSLNLAMLPGTSPNLNQIEMNIEAGDNKKSVTLMIGPEGGFTQDEEQQMFGGLEGNDTNITGVSFGPRILRAETAVIAGITACQLRWGDL